MTFNLPEDGRTIAAQRAVHAESRPERAIAIDLKRSILGVLLAIMVTTAMDAGGLSDFSALPLCPLLFLFWYLSRLSWRNMGFVSAGLRYYGLAILYPVVVLGAVCFVSVAASAIDVSQANWGKASRDVVLIAASTILVAILTEEGFFRGWLFASLDRAGETPTGTLIWSSVAFALWHLSAVSLHTGFDLPVAQIPIFIANAAVMGAIWGLLRLMSGSVIVSSVSHGLWNGAAYVLFGYGTKIGVLGVKNTAIYGPEVGFLGLGLNICFAALLWRWCSVRRREVA